MYTYSKCLTQVDFETFLEHTLIEPFLEKVYPNYRYDHPMRKWEYGLVLKFLFEVRAKRILDVGGGNSILAPILHQYGMKVTQIDLHPSSSTTAIKQNEILGSDIKCIQEDFLKFKGKEEFDAVVCISTIEHIETRKDERLFFQKLLEKAPYLFLTTDFSPKAKVFSTDHYRTYNKVSMNKLANMAKKSGFSYYGEVDYTYDGAMVYDYTFASLALAKEE